MRQTGYRHQTYPAEESNGGPPLSPSRLILASPHTWSCCWMSAQQLHATGCHHTSQAPALPDGQQRSQVPCGNKRLCANHLLCTEVELCSLPALWQGFPEMLVFISLVKKTPCIMEHYVHYSPPMDNILSHLNPMNCFIPYFFKINSNS